MGNGTLDGLIVPVAEAFAGLAGALGSDDGTQLLADLGFAVPPGSDLAGLFSDVVGTLGPLGEALAAVRTAYADGSWKEAAFVGRVIALGRAVGDVAGAAQRLVSRAQATFTAFPDFLATAPLDQLPRRLIDLVLVRQLQAHQPRAAAVLEMLGLIGVREQDTFTLHEVRWERFPSLIAGPADLFALEYGWRAELHAPLLLERLAALLWQFTVSATLEAPGEQLEAMAVERPQLAMPLYTGEGVEVALLARATEDGSGLALAPRVDASSSVDVELREHWALRLEGEMTAEALAVGLRPGGVTIESGALAAQIAAAFIRDAAASPIVVLGSAGATRLELAGVTIKALTRVEGDAFDAGGEVALNGLALIVAAGDGDGFLQKVLPADGIALSVDVLIGWTMRRGLFFGGGAGLAYTAVLNAELGPIVVESVSFALHADPSALAVQGGVEARLTIGPFSAVVRGLGIQLTLGFGQVGNLGNAALEVGYKAPSGVGVAIKSPAVSGGGFLLFDEDAGRYAGVFELTLFGTIAVKAIALITTKLPDGSPGFALLVLITAEGFTPVPLGLGFTLTGIGGLLALNRTVDPDVVRDGLRNGVLDSILFVKDPVKNANRVLSTLDRVFPIAADRLVVGPLAEISWGSPTVIKIRLALLLDLPQPIRAVLLAALSVLLPTPDQPVVEVHIDAVGVLDLGKGELALDASLHDSRIAGFTLSGDMALRLNWGATPGFTLALGGFHPRFPRPAGLRPLNRLALSLTTGDNPRVRFETYLAVTPNTLQMGARVTFRYELGGFGVDGGGSFDALIQWSPFALDVSIAAWVSLFSPAGTLLALSIAVHLTGPSPWHLTGKASITILFFSITVPFDITLGATPTTAPPVDTVDIAALLWTEVADPHNWQAPLPAATRPGATLTTGPGTQPDPAVLVIHPLAVLTIRQHLIPLNTPIARLGARVPTAGTRDYRLQATTPAGVTTTDLTDLFSPGQYTHLTDDQLITTPAFTPAAAGLQFLPTPTAGPPPFLGCDLAVATLEITALDQPATTGTPTHASGPTTPSLTATFRHPRPLAVTR